MTPKTQVKKEKNDKLGLINIKNFCTSKDITKNVNGQPTEWRKYLYITYLIRDLHLKYIKISYNNKKQSDLK